MKFCGSFLLAVAAAVCVYAADRNKYDFEKTFFQVVDQYSTRSYTLEEQHKIFAREHFVDDLAKFHEELNKQQEGFQFVGVSIQPIELVGHWDKPANLVNGYGHKDLRNQKAEFEGKEIELTPIDCYQIDKQSQLVLFGRQIFADDAFVQKGDVVPLILGDGFCEYYKVGDTFEFFYLYQKWTGKVTGFLTKEAELAMDEFSTYSLDHAMVMPFFDQLDRNAAMYDDSEFRLLYFLRKNEGYLKLDQKEDYKEGKRYIEKLARKFGLDYTLLRGY